VIKKCLNCKKDITVKPSQFERKKYCSRKCKAEFQSKNPKAFAHLSKKQLIHCDNCGNQLHRKPSIIFAKNFCNRECKHEHQRKMGHKINQHLINKVEKACKGCGKTYSVIKSRENTSKFCSKNCLGKANGERGKVQYRKRIIVYCTNCGNRIEKKPSVIKKWNFCNESCMAKYYEKSKAFSGSNSATWQGGEIDYYGPNWRSQRRKARKRDNYTCQDCGKTEEQVGHELSIHHIIPFREFNGDWKSANMLSNLVSLCEYPCHRKRHSKKN
jgi:hypothetical protein